jgi:hypothetical protein
VFAILVDRFVLREHVPWLSNLLYFRDAQIVVKPFERKISWLGLGLVLVVPSVVIGVILALYSRITGKATTSESAAVFGLTAFWFVAIPFIVWAGDVVYRVLKALLDKWSWAKGIAAFCEGFVFKGDLYIYGAKLFSIDSGLGALAGLVIGVALLYKKGLWDAIREHM